MWLSVWHYSDVKVRAMVSRITSFTIFYSIVFSDQYQRNIKALRHWCLWGDFIGDRLISPQKGPVTRKIFRSDDVIMSSEWNSYDRLEVFMVMKSKSSSCALNNYILCYIHSDKVM